MSARLLDCTMEAYFNDPCPAPSISKSVATVLLNKSPAHAFRIHPKLGGDPFEPTDVQDGGNIVHKLMLGKGRDLVIVNAKDWRTSAAKEQRDMAEKAGKIAVLADRMDRLMLASATLLNRLNDLGYPLDRGGVTEQAIEWTERGAHRDIYCRCMLDYLDLQNGIILDLKSTENAHPVAVAKRYIEMGFDLQYEAYQRAVAALKPELAGRIEMTYLLCEPTPPYAVVPLVPSGEFREIGRRRWQEALALWDNCLTTKHWPSYYRGKKGDQPLTLEAPGWIVAEFLHDWSGR